MLGQKMVFEDKNGDSVVKKADQEIWCSAIEDHQQVQACEMVTVADAEEACSLQGGEWVSPETNSYRCDFADGTYIIEDADANGLIDLPEYHCESVDENGEPTGNEVVCPTDEIPVGALE